ncbi:MAG: hypothetical protein M3Q39_11250, partial [Actinomycetota bacterium]|nr:hypothetical protein [Actinomycetota bacterium]
MTFALEVHAVIADYVARVKAELLEHVLVQLSLAEPKSEPPARTVARRPRKVRTVARRRARP